MSTPSAPRRLTALPGSASALQGWGLFVDGDRLYMMSPSPKAEVFIFDEPTVGVDVGTKAEVHRLLSELAGQGLVLMKEVLHVISGKRLPAVFNIGARALTSQGLNVHAGHDDLMAQRGQVVAFLRHAFVGGPDVTLDVEAFSALGREQAKALLGLLLRWTRDLLLYRTLGEAAPLVNVDQAESIALFCRNLPGADLEGMARLAEEALELLERNTSARLVFQVLAARLHGAMRGSAPASGGSPACTGGATRMQAPASASTASHRRKPWVMQAMPAPAGMPPRAWCRSARVRHGSPVPARSPGRG